MKYFYLILLSLFLVACSEETPFTSKPSQSVFVTPAPTQYTTINCSNSTTINPQVDVLFLIDNSTSTFYIPSELRQQIINFVGSLGNYNFDYHAMVAPLLPDGGSITQYPVLASDPSDFGVSVNYTLPSNLSLFSQTQSGSVELGFKRAQDVINANKSNNVFRTNSNTLVIVVSNGDDTDYPMNSYGQPMGDWFGYRLQEFKKLTAQYYSGVTPPAGALMSRQLRFVSLVAHSSAGACSGFKIGSRYRNMSNELYVYSGQSDQSGRQFPDSYNICDGNYASIFNTISQSIPSIFVPHTYNWWPVKNTATIDFNTSAIVVKKVIKGVNGDTVVDLPISNVNGFQFDPIHKTNHNIREIPAVSPAYPAENFNGYFVQLFGSGKVTSPDCLIVQIQDPNSHYGYHSVGKNPNPANSVIKKNGVVIPHLPAPGPGQNGWSYIGELASQNKKIAGPGDHTPAYPEEIISGHIIKFWGTATYTNEDILETSVDD